MATTTTTTSPLCMLTKNVDKHGRPYTSCAVRVNPAGYCSECGTLVASVIVDPTTWSGYRWEPLATPEPRWAVEALEAQELEGRWPWLRVGQAMGPLSLGEADLLAAEWRARGWTVRVVELEPGQLRQEQLRQELRRPSDVSGEPREYTPAEPTLEEARAEAEGWVHPDAQDPAAYRAEQLPPVIHDPECDQLGLVHVRAISCGLAVILHDEEAARRREEAQAPVPPLLAAARALGLSDCAPGCTCRGNATTTTPSMLASASPEA